MARIQKRREKLVRLTFGVWRDRKLARLSAAVSLNDLRVLPGNRLEALQGEGAGQHSIRINDQYRICFVWLEQEASTVEIVDRH